MAHWNYQNQLGAAAVNLVAGEKPADVYSGIAARYLIFPNHVDMCMCNIFLSEALALEVVLLLSKIRVAPTTLEYISKTSLVLLKIVM